MTPCTFQRTTVLDAPIEQVFAFHNDPHNITGISPGWQSVRIVRAAPTAKVGEEFEFHLRFFGLPALRWLGIWREVESPVLLVDEAPPNALFAIWRHEHRFRALDAARTEMTDCVTYLFVGGKLGEWFSRTLGKWQFYLMFADRQARTNRWLREHRPVSTRAA